jgi:hypothetical protein
VSPDNPFLQWQAVMSEQIVAALDGYRDLRDSSLEKIFLTLYGSPVLQAMLGLAGTDESPRKRPGLEPERAAFVQQRIGELKARLAEGGAREAAIRAVLYVGMAGSGADERAFNELRQIRSENHGVTLQEFKRILREQYFSLVLDREGALAAIPKMLPPDAASRKHVLESIRRTVLAAGQATGEKAERLAQVEALFAGSKPVKQIEKAPRKTAGPALTQRKARSTAGTRKTNT